MDRKEFAGMLFCPNFLLLNYRWIHYNELNLWHRESSCVNEQTTQPRKHSFSKLLYHVLTNHSLHSVFVQLDVSNKFLCLAPVAFFFSRLALVTYFPALFAVCLLLKPTLIGSSNFSIALSFFLQSKMADWKHAIYRIRNDARYNFQPSWISLAYDNR